MHFILNKKILHFKIIKNKLQLILLIRERGNNYM